MARGGILLIGSDIDFKLIKSLIKGKTKGPVMFIKDGQKISDRHRKFAENIKDYE